jgi:hypothetical protein
MQDQAVELSHAVSIFKLSNSDHSAVSIARSAPAAAMPAPRIAQPAPAAVAKLQKPEKPVVADKSADDWEEF